MGKPFNDELNSLSSTYAWALEAVIDSLADAVHRASEYPMRVVGSGGSLSTATFVANLHQFYYSRLAIPQTPLQVSKQPSLSLSSSTTFVSGTGTNPDIIGSFRAIARRTTKSVLVLCMQPNSPLGRVASEFKNVDVFDYESPSGRDGFLATNSLLASCLLFLRAYALSTGSRHDLPLSFNELMSHSLIWSQVRAGVDPFEGLWQRPLTILLHGPGSEAAASDIESKLAEAALSPVLVSDFRNFAHGRHHWLAKRATETSVLALVTNSDRAIATATLKLLPDAVPWVVSDVDLGGPAADIAHIILGMYLTRSAGDARAIDPGKPGVPEFGRRLYHLDAFNIRRTEPEAIPSRERFAIELKAGRSVEALQQSNTLDQWRRSYRNYLDRIEGSHYSGIALDYDGTLCGFPERASGLGPQMATELSRLLKAGVDIGIVTGRGKSVRRDLQSKIDSSLWRSVVIGYYNGGEIGSLSDEAVPDQDQEPVEPLRKIEHLLSVLLARSEGLKLTRRRHQLTIETESAGSPRSLWQQIEESIGGGAKHGVSVVVSSHSIDILAPGISKISIITPMAHRATRRGISDPKVLCIGDKGRWPGNDFALLSTPYSLSVDETSLNPDSCWNLLAWGSQGVDGTIEYMSGLKADKRGLVRWTPLGNIASRSK